MPENQLHTPTKKSRSPKATKHLDPVLISQEQFEHLNDLNKQGNVRYCKQYGMQNKSATPLARRRQYITNIQERGIDTNSPMASSKSNDK